jgi:F0F1-type ATP synthase membrane subunit b/b'
MNKQIVDIALDVSETLLKKNYSSEDNKKIVDDFINELSNKESNKR